MKYPIAGIASALLLAGCMSVPEATNNPQSSATENAAPVNEPVASTTTNAEQPVTPSQVPMAGSSESGSTRYTEMATAIQPKTRVSYVRSVDEPGQMVSVSSSSLPMVDALRLVFPNQSLIPLDANVDLGRRAQISVNGISTSRFIDIIEELYDVRLSAVGGEVRVAGTITEQVAVPSDFDLPDNFSQEILELVGESRVLMTVEAWGQVMLTGSPSAVDAGQKAVQAVLADEESLVLVVVDYQTPTETFTSSVVVREGTTTNVSFGDASSLAVTLDIQNDFNIQSDLSVNGGAGTGAYAFVSKSGNRVPVLLAETSHGSYGLAYTAKLVEGVFGQ